MLTHVGSLEGSPKVSFMTELQGAVFNCSEAPFVSLSLGFISIRAV